MKKAILICVVSFMGSKAFSQTQASETFTEEKSSEWLLIEAPARPVTRSSSRTSSRPGRTTAPVTTAPPPDPTPTQQTVEQSKPSEAFNKTNSQVKRFKKKSN